jgi:hypothetical protein
MSIYVPLPIPTNSHDAPPSALPEKEQILYDRVLEHFSTADYTLPNINQEKTALTVDEKFWLVGASSYRTLHFVHLVDNDQYLVQTVIRMSSEISTCYELERKCGHKALRRYAQVET